MNDITNRDTALGDITPDQPATGGPAGGVFGNPNGHSHEPPAAVRMLTIEDILAAAELPEKRARICLKANLQAKHDDRVAELATLVDARGELIVDDEASAADVSPESKARVLNDELIEIQVEMRKSMWFPLFRGKSTDDLAVFNKQHLPKGEQADLTDYNIRLVAECCVEPVLSVDDVKALRKKLGSRAMQELVSTAQEVCIRGGVDVPKSPVSLRNLTQQ